MRLEDDVHAIKWWPGPHSHEGGCLVCVHGFWTVSRILGVSVFVCFFDEEAHPYSMKCVSATELPEDQHPLINLACVPVCVCVCVIHNPISWSICHLFTTSHRMTTLNTI